MNNFKLNTMESMFINAHLKHLIENGAETAEELLDDNYSWASMQDYFELFETFTKQTIGGYLSSLEQKGVLCRDEDDDRGLTLWFITEDYLESMNPTQKFSTLKS
jgi:hypothetical protein